MFLFFGRWQEALKGILTLGRVFDFFIIIFFFLPGVIKLGSFVLVRHQNSSWPSNVLEILLIAFWMTK